MTRIGLLSDTHGYWDERYLKYFDPCDQIWHAGDIGSMEVAERLAAFRPLKAVYGNIDEGEICPDTRITAHKSRSSRNIRIPYGPYFSTFQHRQRKLFRPGSNRIKQEIVCLIKKTFRNL